MCVWCVCVCSVSVCVCVCLYREKSCPDTSFLKNKFLYTPFAITTSYVNSRTHTHTNIQEWAALFLVRAAGIQESCKDGTQVTSSHLLASEPRRYQQYHSFSLLELILNLWLCHKDGTGPRQGNSSGIERLFSILPSHRFPPSPPLTVSLPS